MVTIHGPMFTSQVVSWSHSHKEYQLLHFWLGFDLFRPCTLLSLLADDHNVSKVTFYWGNHSLETFLLASIFLVRKAWNRLVVFVIFWLWCFLLYIINSTTYIGNLVVDNWAKTLPSKFNVAIQTLANTKKKKQNPLYAWFCSLHHVLQNLTGMRL